MGMLYVAPISSSIGGSATKTKTKHILFLSLLPPRSHRVVEESKTSMCQATLVEFKRLGWLK